MKLKRKPLSLVEFIALFSLITSLTAMSIDAMLPAFGAIQTSLNVASSTNIPFIVTLFILGMVFGEIIFGPLSDAFGRIAAILGGLVIFAIGALIALQADSLSVLLLGRVIQGIGVSGPKIASRALIRDRYKGDQMARIMSFIFTIFIFVPMIAPSLGQAIMSISSWRAIFGFYLVLAFFVGVWLWLRQEETLANEHRIPLSRERLSRNFWLICRNKKVMLYTAIAGFCFGANLTYLSLSQPIFVDIYNKGTAFPLYFALLASAIGISALTNSQLVLRLGSEKLSVLALIGMVIVSALFLIQVSIYDGVPPFWTFIVASYATFFCFGFIFSNINSMAMVSLGRVAGLGASFIASFSSLIAVTVAVGFGRFLNGSVTPLILCYLLMGLASLLFVLWAKRLQDVEV